MGEKRQLVELCGEGMFSVPLVPPRPFHAQPLPCPDILAGQSRGKGPPGPWCAAAVPSSHILGFSSKPRREMEGRSETSCVLWC